MQGKTIPIEYAREVLFAPETPVGKMLQSNGVDLKGLDRYLGGIADSDAKRVRVLTKELVEVREQRHQVCFSIKPRQEFKKCIEDAKAPYRAAYPKHVATVGSDDSDSISLYDLQHFQTAVRCYAESALGCLGTTDRFISEALIIATLRHALATE